MSDQDLRSVGVVSVRFGRVADYPAIAAIEAVSFPWVDAWGEDMFDLACRSGLQLIVLDHLDQVIGFAWVHVGTQVVEIRRLAIAPAWRRRGCGRLLVDAIRRDVSRFNVLPVAAVVEETDDDGISFFRAVGARAVRVWRGRFLREHACRVDAVDGIVLEFPREGGR